jgi:hypothetical protein
MGKIIEFKERENIIEYDSCNLYCFSPIKPEGRSLHCVLFYDINQEFYRLNIYNSEDQNLFTNLFSQIGLNSKELIKLIKIYNIEINDEIIQKIKEEPKSSKRKQKYNYIISNVTFL